MPKLRITVPGITIPERTIEVDRIIPYEAGKRANSLIKELQQEPVPGTDSVLRVYIPLGPSPNDVQVFVAHYQLYMVFQFVEDFCTSRPG